MNLVVLAMVGWAIVRRTLVRPRLIPWNLDAGLILGAIASLMVSHFAYHAYQVAGEMLAAGGDGAPYLPISNALGHVLAPLSATAAARGQQFGYWLHVRAHRADVPQLPALLQAHPLARRAAQHLRAQPQPADDGPAQAQPRGREPVGRRPVRAAVVEEPARHLRRAPECARCSNLLPRRTTPARTAGRRCSSSTTSATRCSTASRLKDKIGELETEVSRLEE